VQVQKTNKMVEYNVTSRLIVGGRVYLPKHSITLDEAEGEVLCMRGFITRKVPAKIAPEKAKSEPAIPPSEIGVVTKDDATKPAPATPAPAAEQEDKESTYHGKSARKNR
jgi:hypothetical protein